MTTTSTTAASAAIEISNFTFQPPLLQVRTGTRVTVHNGDGVQHTWTADGGAWDSGDLSPDGRFTFTFTEPGTFSYHCAIHSSMKGSVTVSA